MDANAAPKSPKAGRDASFKERRVARHEVGETARLAQQALYNIEVKVQNVSTCGFMAECGEAVRIGSHVALDVPGLGPVHAQVRWQIGNRMGGMFLDPISLARCEWTGVKAEKAEAA
ncbi:MAG: hypothetical protein ACT4N8_02045 [Sphingosinicella sp.]|uniref:hypothetical protein n=1 Tax=Sphingosinicella sp. TaxID=1917971 RepID=UPI00403827EF